MPNWCFNILVLEGPTEILDKFQEDNKGTDEEGEEISLSFQQAIPIPETDPNWYDKRVASWGTKWDLSDEVEIKDHKDKGTLIYRFDTAWAPPDAWLKHVAKRYTDIKFHLKYIEPGMGFKGKVDIKDGKVLNDTHEDIVGDCENFMEELEAY